MSETFHLERRNGVYYYRRRVPDEAVAAIGARTVKYSLGTSDKKEARRRRELEDLKWSARFENISALATGGVDASTSATLNPDSTIELLRDYVARMDRKSHGQGGARAADREELDDRRSDAEQEIAILRNPEDPRAAEQIFGTVRKLLTRDGSIEKAAEVTPDIEELVRRALLEIGRRRLARLEDDFTHPYFDHLFGPSAQKPTTFADLASQYLRAASEDAEANGISQKRIDKVEANVALIREILGDDTLLSAIDYDACLRARNVLAHTPTNRTKLYPKLSLEAAIAKAKAEGKAILSATTQGQYLETLKGILELAALKRLIPNNPAQSLRPLKRDDTAPGDKRRSFTLDQIKTFFASEFYQSCAPEAARPYARKDREWRFWLPLLCLFMGMRPNEACQMLAGDVKRTTAGTWYVDVATSTDDDDLAPAKTGGKTLKTAASRRRIPIHPELLSIGFIRLSEGKAAADRLFVGLKPDKYGNLATYALRRFRETYLPAEITVEPRQSFYSFRHSFRDALRRIDAQPATLQALGGWTQGSLVSDHYGDQMDPDYQAKWIAKVEFEDLRLEHLHLNRAIVPHKSQTAKT